MVGEAVVKLPELSVLCAGRLLALLPWVGGFGSASRQLQNTAQCASSYSRVGITPSMV